MRLHSREVAMVAIGDFETWNCKARKAVFKARNAVCKVRKAVCKGRWPWSRSATLTPGKRFRIERGRGRGRETEKLLQHPETCHGREGGVFEEGSYLRRINFLITQL